MLCLLIYFSAKAIFTVSEFYVYTHLDVVCPDLWAKMMSNSISLFSCHVVNSPFAIFWICKFAVLIFFPLFSLTPFVIFISFCTVSDIFIILASHYMYLSNLPISTQSSMLMSHPPFSFICRISYIQYSFRSLNIDIPWCI